MGVEPFAFGDGGERVRKNDFTLTVIKHRLKHGLTTESGGVERGWFLDPAPTTQALERTK